VREYPRKVSTWGEFVQEGVREDSLRGMECMKTGGEASAIYFVRGGGCPTKERSMEGKGRQGERKSLASTA